MTNLEPESKLEKNFYVSSEALEACHKIEKFFEHVVISEHKIRSLSPVVTSKEFVDAVNLLVQIVSGETVNVNSN